MPWGVFVLLAWWVVMLTILFADCSTVCQKGTPRCDEEGDCLCVYEGS